MYDFDYKNFGLNEQTARIGFCFKDIERPEILIVKPDGVAGFYKGALARFKVNGGHEMTVEEAKILRDLLNEFIERAQNA